MSEKSIIVANIVVLAVLTCVLGFGGIALYLPIAFGALLITVFGIRSSYHLLRDSWHHPQQGKHSQQLAVATSSGAVFILVFVSAVIGFAATLGTIRKNLPFGAPGWWLTSGLDDASGLRLDLWFMFLLACVTNSAVCLAVLWGAYVVWARSRRRSVA